MKRVLFLVFFSVLSICVSAQSVDSLQSELISIDSLSVKLSKLQRDYDFMFCQHELEEALSRLNFLRCDITNAALAIRIEMCAHNFDVDLYISFKNFYDANVLSRNSLMNYVKMKKQKCELMISSVDFFADEVFNLKSTIMSIDNTFNVIDSSLNYYKECLDQYKKMK